MLHKILILKLSFVKVPIFIRVSAIEIMKLKKCVMLHKYVTLRMCAQLLNTDVNIELY
jgi:hypothetical protein